MFDCAFKAAKGQRSIHYMGHIKMMGATQPFISGAISKTVNVPKDASVDEIMQAYIQSWKLGAKAISIYRDGSKRTQPLNTSRDKTAAEIAAQTASELVTRPVRRKLPDERQAITHKFDIQGHEGYITVGLFENGQPGEIFLVMAKEGSTISGFADAFAQAISYALQYGVPLQALVDKFSHVRFEPSGMTRNPEIRFAKSIVDYIFRWMASKFLSRRSAVPRRRQRPGARRERPGHCWRRRPRPNQRRPRRRSRRGRRVDGVLDDSESGRCAALLDLRRDHDPQRRLLQVLELRQYQRLRLISRHDQLADHDNQKAGLRARLFHLAFVTC